MSNDVGTEIVRRFGLYFVALIAGGVVLFFVPYLSGDARDEFPIPDVDGFMQEQARVLEEFTGLSFHTLPELTIVKEQEDLTRVAVARARLAGATPDDEADIRERLSSTLAIYSPDEHRIVARTHMFGEVATKEMASYVLTHELVHALDALHFEVAKTLPMGLEAQKVRTALMEGHAVFVTAQIFEGWGHQDLAQYIDRGYYSDDSRAAPYWQGGRFFNALFKRGGNDLVLHAMRNPPATMDVILNPSSFRR